MEITKAEIEESHCIYWKHFLVEYLNVHSPYVYYGDDYRRVEIVPECSPPQVDFFLRSFTELNPIVIGSDWLKENLTPQQFSEYVVELMSGNKDIIRK